MTTPSERIHAMVREGRVGPAEGERLLRALEAPGARPGVRRGFLCLLLDPFARWGGGIALVPSAIFVVVALAASRLGVRFDGFIDLHPGAPPALWVSVMEQLIAWPLGAATLWAMGRALGGPGRRFVDFLGAVGVARGPVALLSIPIRLLAPSSLDVGKLSAHSLNGLLALSIVAIVCVVWQVTLLFYGYRNASGLRGPKLGFSFGAAVLLAEVVSKIALSFVGR